MDGGTENLVGAKGVFVSTFKHSLDPKRRLTIPAEWRDQVGTPNNLYVLQSVHEKCLCIYPAAEIMGRMKNIRQHSIADKMARQFARVLASKSDLVAWDSQGRIRIKDELLEYAGLVDEVVLVGAFDCFEVWTPERLKESGGLDDNSIKDAAQYVGF
jgi:MraZ protein